MLAGIGFFFGAHRMLPTGLETQCLPLPSSPMSSHIHIPRSHPRKEGERKENVLFLHCCNRRGREMGEQGKSRKIENLNFGSFRLPFPSAALAMPIVAITVFFPSAAIVYMCRKKEEKSGHNGTRKTEIRRCHWTLQTKSLHKQEGEKMGNLGVKFVESHTLLFFPSSLSGSPVLQIDG